MIKYVFAKDNAELFKIQDKAVKAINSARVAIQVATIATIQHMLHHHDYTVASRLVDNLGNTINGKALVSYFVKYGGLTVGKVKVVDEKGKETEVDAFNGLVKDYDNVVMATFDEAKAKPWWTLKTASPYKGFNLEQALQNVLAQNKRAQEKLAKGEVSAEDVKVKANDDTIKAVLALCNFTAIIEGDLPEDARQVA